MSWLQQLRVRAHEQLMRLPGKTGELVRRANDVLGRPLADAEELADRHVFATRNAPASASAPTPSAPAPAAARTTREAAPVIVYHMDKTRRDATKLTEILDGVGIPYKVINIQEDPAAQFAVKRDSKGFRMPVVFIAGEAIGGRSELVNLSTSGELTKKVFGESG